jgi:hypothetical protein
MAKNINVKDCVWMIVHRNECNFFDLNDKLYLTAYRVEVIGKTLKQNLVNNEVKEDVQYLTLLFGNDIKISEQYVFTRHEMLKYVSKSELDKPMCKIRIIPTMEVEPEVGAVYARSEGCSVIVMDIKK